MGVGQRLILHAGLPKTGTSSLQIWADANRPALRAQGVDYPEASGLNLIHPKHQVLVSAIMQNRIAELEPLLARRNASTLLLSSEGLSNHLYDLPAAGLASFRDRTAAIDVSAFLVLREADSWLRSMYKQCVINAPAPAYLYGTSLTYAEFRLHPRLQRLIDHAQLGTDLKSAFGASEVITVPPAGDWLGSLCDMLGIGMNADFVAPPRANVSLSDDLVELVRQVNGMELSAELRNAFLALAEKVLQTANDSFVFALRAQVGSSIDAESLRNVVGQQRPENDLQSLLIGKLLSSLPTFDGAQIDF